MNSVTWGDQNTVNTHTHACTHTHTHKHTHTHTHTHIHTHTHTHTHTHARTHTRTNRQTNETKKHWLHLSGSSQDEYFVFVFNIFYIRHIVFSCSSNILVSDSFIALSFYYFFFKYLGHVPLKRYESVCNKGRRRESCIGYRFWQEQMER